MPGSATTAGAAPTTERYVPGTGKANRHVLAVLVNNQPGVLNRVASLVRARNFNIESLAVGHTERPDVSRMTITLRGDDFAVEQMEKQLYRLIDVLKVQAMPATGSIEHELALIKVRATERNRAELLKVVELYKGRVLDVSPDALIVEYGGTEQEVDALIALLGGYGIRELVRTGVIAMTRGASAIDVDQILKAGVVPALPQAATSLPEHPATEAATAEAATTEAATAEGVSATNDVQEGTR
jgi:acetolactate synthase-1/3 small subunit